MGFISVISFLGAAIVLLFSEYLIIELPEIFPGDRTFLRIIIFFVSLVSIHTLLAS